jgi:hypothetical protein
MTNRYLNLLCLASLLLAAGCGHGKMGTVTGTVSYKGKPLATGAIVFDMAGARSAQGKIVDGRITEVTTYAPGDGVALGKARIAIFATEPAKAVPARPEPKTPAEVAAHSPKMTGGASLIPAKYNSPATSGLTRDIVAGENVLTLDLE